jgi:hypothetical protein
MGKNPIIIGAVIMIAILTVFFEGHGAVHPVHVYAFQRYVMG